MRVPDLNLTFRLKLKFGKGGCGSPQPTRIASLRRRDDYVFLLPNCEDGAQLAIEFDLQDAVGAGVNLIATDQYEDLAAVMR